MKTTPVLAILILAAGTGGFCTLRNSTATSQSKVAAAREAHAAEARRLAQAQGEFTELTECVRTLKEKRAGHAGGIGTAGPVAPAAAVDFRHPDPEEAERLLAELGFNWNSTGDYLVVSKSTLFGIRLEGMKGDKPSETACQVLAITPAERASLEARAQQLRDSSRTWALAHVQRAEPEGDIVAKYTIQFDDTFARNLKNAFESEASAVLGPERSELFLQYTGTWMSDLGMNGGPPTTMTVKRYQLGNQSRLGLEVKCGGSMMSTDVSPWQPMPSAFGSLFPGGWPDLAAREGFELPKEFQKK